MINHIVNVKSSLENATQFYLNRDYNQLSPTLSLHVPHGSHMFKFDDSFSQIQIAIAFGDSSHSVQLNYYVKAVKNSAKFSLGG